MLAAHRCGAPRSALDQAFDFFGERSNAITSAASIPRARRHFVRAQGAFRARKASIRARGRRLRHRPDERTAESLRAASRGAAPRIDRAA
jgi:hypothetical protein